MATQVVWFPVLLKWYYCNGIILIKDSSLRKEGLLMTESFPLPARLQGDSASLPQAHTLCSQGLLHRGGPKHSLSLGWKAMSPKESTAAPEICQQSKQKLLFPQKMFHLPVPFQNYGVTLSLATPLCWNNLSAP